MNITFEEIKSKNLTGVYVSSDHSSGFDYCELDWKQDCVWKEGDLQDSVGSIKEFFDEMVDKRFWLLQCDAFNKVNTYYYIR